MRVRRIICLANSDKFGGRCIAGKLYEEGQPPTWMRPVSGPEHGGAILNEHRRYSDGSLAKLLDCIDIPIARPTPKGCQKENRLIVEGCAWTMHGRATRPLLERLLDDAKALWINGGHSWHGENDKITLDEANRLDNSLAFIWVDELRVRSSVESPDYSPKRKVRAFFEWGGVSYALTVTDPVIKKSVLAKPNGEHVLQDAFMCISLGEPLNDNVYKLVASIITPQRLSQ